ncbi:MAG: hypothetical protein ACTS3F_08465 [Phycisphaerales bacterium]
MGDDRSGAEMAGSEAGPWMERAGGIARWVGLLGGAATLVAGAVGLYAAARAGLGAQAGLEVVVVLSGVMAVLIGLGVVRGGIGISLLCVSGAVLVSSLLTEPSVRFAITGGGTVPDRSGVDMVMLFAARAVLGALFGAAGVITVIERHPKRSLLSLLKAGVALAPCAAVGAVWVVPSIRNAVTGIHPVVTGFAATVSLVLMCGLFAAAVQWTVDAFAAGKTLGRRAAA